MADFISVDWDFFPRMDLGKKYTLNRGDGKTAEVSGAFVFDWGHGESPFLINSIWGVRAGQWKTWGLDIEKEVALHDVSTTDFAEALLARYEDPGPLYVAESHMYAYEVVRAAYAPGERVRVVNFDAHHDLGYGPDAATATHYDCGSWLLTAMRMGYVDEVLIVYPDWKGTDEYEPHEFRKPWEDRIEVTTWSKWLASSPDYLGETAGMFACRSGAWTPPWLDSEFEQLIDELAVAGSDTVISLPNNDSEDISVRPWDEDSYMTLPTNEEIREKLAAIAEHEEARP
jgi:hypothetical protein